MRAEIPLSDEVFYRLLRRFGGSSMIVLTQRFVSVRRIEHVASLIDSQLRWFCGTVRPGFSRDPWFTINKTHGHPCVCLTGLIL